ncbi:ABC transporter permease [Streptomyces montanisoli]|uniref:ABC transporter permease n=1 Tax=Streptomyces montanisoli TaxID=2798581 RepID=A0A940RWJ5_9ACTN|nr:ABC transporter permease [Streptomyces montanisoli]MBP0456669.1 ABC transporter permease [Streptomyces montanisoli]
MLHLALRMAAHKLTALIAVACAVLGGAALLTGTGVLAESGLRSHVPPGRLGGADVVVAADQEFHPAGDLPIALPERATVPAGLVGRLAEVDGVTAAVGDVGFPAALVGPGDGRVLPAEDPGASGHGWSSTALLPKPRIEGHPPSGAGEVAVPASAGFRVGERVRVVTGDRPSAASGARKPSSSYLVSAVVDAPGAGVYFADGTARRLSGRAGGPRAGTVDLIGLRTAPGAADSVAAAVREQLAGTKLKVLTGPDRGTAVAPGVSAARSMLLLLAGSLAGILLMVIGFVTAGALSASIAGQRRDLALMRAVGATPRQIRRLAAFQASAIAVAAAVPGIVLGYLLAGRFSQVLADRAVLPRELPLTVSPLPTLATLVLMLAVVQVSARCAAWRTSRLPATEAVAESRSEPRTPSRARTLTGLLLIAVATASAVTPLFARTMLGATSASIAGIVAAIGLALSGPALVKSAGGAALRRMRPGASAPSRLAVAGLRAHALRFSGVISPLAMGIVFVLTYTLTQTTVLAATRQDVRAGTLAQYTLSAPRLGGVPAGTLPALRRLPGVKAAEPVTSTTAVWQYQVFGETTSEPASAMILPPGGAAGVLDLGVRDGDLARLKGATVAVSSAVAAARDAEPGGRVRLILGDGARVTARVVAVYDRGLGFGPLVLSRDLAAGHTTVAAAQSVLVRTDGSATAGDALAALAGERSGLVLSGAGAGAGAGADAGTGSGSGAGQQTPPEVWINLAVIVVLLAYLLLSIANKLVTATVQRRTEIAALRLVGTTPGQVRAMMRREAAMVAAMACGAGLVVSAVPLVLLGQGFLGRPWPAGPVWLLPVAVAVLTATSFVALELPTRRALRTPPAEALRAA